MRKGLLSVKLELQDLKTPRGRQFAELVEQSAIKQEQENRYAHICNALCLTAYSENVLCILRVYMTGNIHCKGGDVIDLMLLLFFRMIHATPKPTKKPFSSANLDDSMPRSSPSAYKPMVSSYDHHSKYRLEDISMCNNI